MVQDSRGRTLTAPSGGCRSRRRQKTGWNGETLLSPFTPAGARGVCEWKCVSWVRFSLYRMCGESDVYPRIQPGLLDVQKCFQERAYVQLNWYDRKVKKLLLLADIFKENSFSSTNLFRISLAIIKEISGRNPSNSAAFYTHLTCSSRYVLSVPQEKRVFNISCVILLR